MMEMVVFAVTLAVALLLGNLVTTMIVMKYFMNKTRLKKYSKTMMEVSEELVEEMFKSEEGV